MSATSGSESKDESTNATRNKPGTPSVNAEARLQAANLPIE
jgi:hypothetical protein